MIEYFFFLGVKIRVAPNLETGCWYFPEKMGRKLVFYFFSSCLFMVNCYSYRGSKIIKDKCPDLYEKPFKGFVPKGNLSAGEYLCKNNLYNIYFGSLIIQYNQ